MHGEADAGEWSGLLVFIGVLLALVAVFLAALALPVAPGWRRWVTRCGFAVGGAGLVLLANVALYRHDGHLDLTREKAFTPAPDTARVVRALDRDVTLTYFYQNQDPASRQMRAMLTLIGKMNPRLTIRAVDPDRNPGEANRLGARLYNTAVLETAGARETVTATDDREIALGLLRLLRIGAKTICFVTGHGEYDIDNFEFHTHFEGSGGHGHDIQGGNVVEMEQHGLGRLRRALEKLGLAAKKVSLSSDDPAAAGCAVAIDANPRTRHTPPESQALLTWLEQGGAFMLLAEPDFEIDPSLAAVLARAGVRFGEGVVTDPKDHYFTDARMVAISRYAAHPATARLALSIFPGVRPVAAVPAADVTSVALFASGPASFLGPESSRGPLPLAAASEGRLAPGAKPFRLAVFGDADFASNSFFPYLSNADLVLGTIGWLLREERAATMKPPVEVLPLVTLTQSQVNGIFLVTVLLVPGLLAAIGIGVWWVRRR